VDWRYGGEQMWERHNVATTEADEAVADIAAVWFDPDPHSRSELSVRVIGYSHSRRAVPTVSLVPRADDQGYWGANGWDANTSDPRRYERGS
jgi:uncharacterized DUF497 family protein